MPRKKLPKLRNKPVKEKAEVSVARFFKEDKYLGGRPKKITEDILRKLKEAFLIGCTDEEACFYANIGIRTMYDFQEANDWFSQWKEALKDNPTIQARKTLFAGLGKSEDAKWFLERKKKKEFSPRSEITDGEGNPVVVGFNYVVPEKKNDNDTSSNN